MKGDFIFEKRFKFIEYLIEHGPCFEFASCLWKGRMFSEVAKHFTQFLELGFCLVCITDITVQSFKVLSNDKCVLVVAVKSQYEFVSATQSFHLGASHSKVRDVAFIIVKENILIDLHRFIQYGLQSIFEWFVISYVRGFIPQAFFK